MCYLGKNIAKMSEDWIETTNGNRISKCASIYGSNHISINDNTTINENVLLQGDVNLLQKDEQTKPTTIKLGKYCYLGMGCQIIPPIIKSSKSDDSKFHGPISIGSYSIIGENTVIKLALIGNRVLIEKNCSLNDLSIVYDCCIIRKNSIVPAKTIIPPFSEVSGQPGIDFQIKDLSNSYKKLIELEARKLQVLG